MLITHPRTEASADEIMPDRLQQEIDDLLSRLETTRPKRSFASRVRSAIGGAIGSVVGLFNGISLPHLSAGHILLIAISVIVVAYLALPEGSDLTRWIIAGGIVAFILAFALSLRRSATGGRPPQKYWRDKPIDLRSSGRIRSWWARRRDRR